MQINRGKAEELDSRDPLGDFRDEFVLKPGLIYLDGNSLGPMHASVRERMRACIENEWANDLIASWNTAGWIDRDLLLRQAERLAKTGYGDYLRRLAGRDRPKFGPYRPLYGRFHALRCTGWCSATPATEC